MVNYKIPAITADQMREVDRLMVEVYGIELLQMMENAGRNLAALTRRLFLGGESANKHVLVLAGSGGNGGGGMVAARRLWNWGAEVQVFITRPGEDLRGVPAHQLQILQKMRVPIQSTQGVDALPHGDVILDAVLGYSLVGIPRGEAARLIRMANIQATGGTPVLSLDVPSGLESTTGEVYDPCIRASATMTLALPKTGLLKANTKSNVGELYLAGISIPPRLFEAMGIELPPIFADEEIIRIF